jgi:hypothetical protein
MSREQSIWDAIYSTTFAILMTAVLTVDNNENALDDDRVIGHVRAMAERIADAGAGDE